MSHSPTYRRILHRMGYYSYQQGLIYRHLNQQDEWEGHIRHCRSFIMKALDIVRPSHATVFGSGWLMELPLAEMAEKIERITLVDIVHPPEVIRQSAELKNVRLSEQDVSGGLIQEVWNKAGKRTYFNRLPSLETIEIPEYETEEDPGMVLSVNILTQLEVLPERLLRKRSKASESELLGFRRKIQEKHIGFLKKHKSVLISDEAELISRSDTTSAENRTLLTELPEGVISDTWTWNFDLTHTDFNRQKSTFRVVALLM